jgi:hypothetical protein
MFFVVGDGQALAGNNEDFWDCNTKVWFTPAQDGKHGGVYFGFDNGFAQGGMNDQGLCFDGFATGPCPVKDYEGKIQFDGNLIMKAMEECATVEDVVAMFDCHDLRFLQNAMLMFADRTGDSVIIEGDVFLRKEGRYQVVTNFYQSRATPGSDPCPRFRIANQLLEEAEEVSVELCKRVLAGVHNEQRSPTLYSNVYDLKKGLVYVYHFHNFENVVVFDLAEELKKGARTLDLPSLFPETFAASQFAAKRQREIEEQKRKRRAKDVDPKVLDEYVGRYELTIPGRDPVVFNLQRKGGVLVASDEDSEETQEYLPASRTTFFHVSDEGTTDLVFQRDDEGKVVGVVVKTMLGTSYSGTKIE